MANCIKCKVRMDSVDWYNERGMCVDCARQDELLRTIGGVEPEYEDNLDYYDDNFMGATE